jgi:hypothetical protein
MTRKNPVPSGLENLGIGFVGGIVSFFIGKGFDSLINA